MRLPFSLQPSPGFFLDIYFQSIMVGSRVRCKPIAGQQIDSSMWVECNKKERGHYPIGTIFKSDMRMVQPKNRKTYLATIKKKNLTRAVEYFDYNLSLLNIHQ